MSFSFRHPHFETAKERDRREFEEEIERFTKYAEEQRKELERKRVLEAPLWGSF